MLRHTFLCKFASAVQEGTTTISVKQANLVLLSVLQTNKSLEGNRLTWEKAKAVLKAHGCKNKGLRRDGLKDGIESARIMGLPSQERSLLCQDMYRLVAQQIEAHGLTRPLTPGKSKRKPAGKSGDLKPSSDHELADAKDEIPRSSRTGETLVICPKDWRNIDAPPLLGMVCEALVVCW
jgi:hypothetical protein